MLKKLLDIFEFILYLMIIFSIIYLGFVMWFPDKYSSFSKYKMYVVVSDSMAPTIEPMSLVIVDKEPKTEYVVNDIVTFKYDVDNSGEPDIITHRIAEIKKENVVSYRTRPENLSRIDPWEIPENDIIGLVIKIIPKLGLIILGIQKVGIAVLIIFDLLILILLLQTYIRWEDL